MQFLKNITIRTALLWVLGIFCVLWGGVAAYTVVSLNKLTETTEASALLVQNIDLLNHGNDQYFRTVTRLSRAVESVAANEPNPDFDSAGKALANLQDAYSDFKKLGNASIDPDIVKQVTDDWQALIEQGVSPLFQAAKSGDTASYRQLARVTVPTLSRQFSASNARYTKQATAKIDASKADFHSIASTSKVILIAALTFGVLLLIATDRYLVMAVVKPLDTLRGQFAAIAKGDLGKELNDFGSNCVGKLIPLLRDMQNSLAKTVMAIRACTDNIYQGASEISAGNNDLSSRTEEQASALEETAASMEQLTATVKHNADNAHHASQLASTASVTAQKGGQIVADVVRTMQEISGSSKKIAEITTVINSIAFQTNILALNAAVEAARAGEQGRGFAVVASEVRNLAQRSAQAAKEIENLISESVTRVDSGSKLVASAGQTMGDIVQSITHVTDIMGEIASASDEQSKGISQVALAVTEMDSVTQQNAALVEQASQAALSLEEQAAVLNQTVATFTLRDGAVRTPAVAAAPVKSVAVVSARTPASGQDNWETF
ncbi:methyl-accepting chemotaxis protein [Chimaeribacter californicus]|uniref:Methyl-accepting chemotaxis protein n=1 Tax=Chimaeribacter californicus TaxID=2060067 RepID=A0A2N5EA68_9GAMM|nr:methyl-accepting chemotaxis protein [Chimaeribacter californicus]PLR38808.1 methyl-accepting chemotaxis protein [Chimaeribacter californicus]